MQTNTVIQLSVQGFTPAQAHEFYQMLCNILAGFKHSKPAYGFNIKSYDINLEVDDQQIDHIEVDQDPNEEHYGVGGYEGGGG